jgi:hypothetical protein
MANRKFYEAPHLIGYGSIADRTLGRSYLGCDDRTDDSDKCPPKDINACENDKFGEWSCNS